MYQCVEIQLRGKIINISIETDINAYAVRYLQIFYTLTNSTMLSILAGHFSSFGQEVFFCKENIYSKMYKIMCVFTYTCSQNTTN